MGRVIRLLLYAGLGAFLLLFLVWPLLSLVAVSLTGEPVNVVGRWFLGQPLQVGASLQYYREFLHTPRYYKGLVNSLLFSGLVTLASCALGVAVSLVLERTAIPLKPLLRVLAVLPLAIPPYLMALSFMILFGKAGMVTRLLGPVFDPFTPLGTGLVQVFAFFPVAMLTTSAALERLDPSLEEAARVSGGPLGFVFWTVTVPLLRPGLVAGAFLTFIRSFGDFATPLLLMPPSVRLIVVEAYRDMSGNAYWGGASMLSTVMVLVVLGLTGWQKYVERHRLETVGGRAAATARLYRGTAGCRLLLVAMLLVLSFPLLNVGVLGILSLASSWGREILPGGWTLANYAAVLGTSSQYLLNSLVLSLLAVLLGLVLGFGVAFILYRTTWRGRHALDVLVGLPFIVPGTAFAIALVTVFNQPPLALHLTATLVVIAYVVTRAPYAVRSVTASLSQVGPSVEEASRTLGAPPPLTLWKVLLPLVRPGLLSGGLMIFMSCVMDVSITLMICPPAWYPASIRIFTETQESHYFVASAYGIVLMLMVVAAHAGMMRIGKGQEVLS